MRARAAQLRRPTSRTISLPAPVKGWNSRDALADMDPLYAPILTNWFPRPTYCETRAGYSRWATGITGWVETLMQYTSGTATSLFAAANTNIYDVSAGGAVGAAVVTGKTNARWQYVNNTTAGGSYIQAVNGADKMIVYDGSAWHKDGDGSPYDITGVDSSTCIGIALSHNRVWLTQVGTLKAWYGPTGSIGGAFNSLDLSSFCERGGQLMAIIDWTMDAGYGMDDMTVFLTSRGEALVYKGTDPSSVTTWGLIGRYWVGSPIGRRCMQKYKGDVIVINRDGLQPMSLALQSSRLNARISLTDTIQSATSEAISLYGSNFGWHIQPYPDQDMLILNVPLQESAIQQQYVMNTITQAWCNFTGWNAACWELWSDKIYFGGNGYVGLGWSTLADNGGDIVANGLQAFNYFKTPAMNKQFTQMRPVLNTNGAPALATKLNINFDLSDPTASASFTAPGYGIWDAGLWDTALWGPGMQIQNSWQGANGVGTCAAPHLLATCQGINVQWMSTDVLYNPGGQL